VEGTSALNPLIVNYFTNLFSTEVDVTYPDFLAKIDQKVTVAMNERLMAPFLG
jgi:hypothetical protein